MSYFCIEYLPGELAGLGENLPAIFGVCIVPKIGSLVEKSLSVGIKDNSKWITVFLKSIAYTQVAKLRRIPLPPHRMAA